MQLLKNFELYIKKYFLAVVIWALQGWYYNGQQNIFKIS